MTNTVYAEFQTELRNTANLLKDTLETMIPLTRGENYKLAELLANTAKVDPKTPMKTYEDAIDEALGAVPAGLREAMRDKMMRGALGDRTEFAKVAESFLVYRTLDIMTDHVPAERFRAVAENLSSRYSKQPNYREVVGAKIHQPIVEKDTSAETILFQQAFDQAKKEFLKLVEPHARYFHAKPVISRRAFLTGAAATAAVTGSLGLSATGNALFDEDPMPHSMTDSWVDIMMKVVGAVGGVGGYMYANDVLYPSKLSAHYDKLQGLFDELLEKDDHGRKLDNGFDVVIRALTNLAVKHEDPSKLVEDAISGKVNAKAKGGRG